METIDFSRSFLMFRIDTLKKPPETTTHKPPFTLNNARIQIDCHCEITDKRTGDTQAFVLGASCKTERVGVDRDIWTEPNADFVPILSMERFLTLKTYDRAGQTMQFYPPVKGTQSDRQTGGVADAFDSIRIDLWPCQGEVLETSEQIVEATLANEPLVARTVIEEGRYVATLDYPVKTMNANERDNIYQTDTGPILLPDFSREPEDLVAGLDLAFSAFNSPDWIELIVRVPTPIAEEISVQHYSRTVRYDSKNQVIRLL